MAEAIFLDIGADIAKEIGSKIIEKLGSAAFEKLKSVKDLESNIQKLREIKSIIEAELHKFDPFESRSADLEGNRIKRLDRVHGNLVRFFEKLETRAKQKEVMSSAEKILSAPNQLVSPFKTAGKVNALMKELQSIANDFVQYSSIVSHSPVQNRNSFTSTAETIPFRLTEVLIGRDTDKENIVNKICNSTSNDHDRVVAIVGVGGQGKTTLAQFVCQDDRVKRSFDRHIWVSLTPESSINDILQKMIISATGKEPNYTGLQQLVQLVLQAIDGNKCLLVLDNVYFYKNLRDDSEALNAILEQGCFWSNGGKILITSRSKKVAEYMSSFNPYELHDLAEDDCWRLLRHYANEDDNNDRAVEAVGKEIVRMCPKVPLVLKTTARSLADMNKSEWETFKNRLASNATVYMEQQDKVKQILKLSYDQLHYNLKCCAAYCSLFPKGHEYDKDYMVRNWIALGYVESRDDGDAYVLELTQRAFFEEAGTFQSFKMHDVMHDLMQMVGKNKHQMIDSKTEAIAEGVHHVSLDMKHLRWDVLLSSTIDKQALESILLVLSRWDDREHGARLGSDIDMLVLACRNLKILEIYKQDIKKVPRCIGKLTNMRHLDLSDNDFCKLPKEITNLVKLSTLNLSCCTNLEKLPQEMEKLENLSSLDLSWCHQLQELPRKMGKMVKLVSLDLRECWSLKELPKDMGKLVNLTHLRLKRCYELRCMPEGIKNLTKLERLGMFVVGENSGGSWIRGSSKGEVGAKLEELGHLENLQGGLCIKLGEESKYLLSEAGDAHLEKKTKLSKLRIVFKKRAEEDESFLEGMQLGGENWKGISVYNYGGKRLPMWMTDGQFHERFPKLSTLVLQRDESSSLIIPTPTMDKDKGEFISVGLEGDEDDMVEWVPIYSRLKGQLKMGTIKMSFNTRRDGLTLTDLRDQTLHDVKMEITEELAPVPSSSGCGRQRQPDVLFKSCFPNLIMLHLFDIPELEVLPEEFRDLSSLRNLRIYRCKKMKAIPDWIDSLSSLYNLAINDAPELKVLPDSIGSLTSLECLWLSECRELELQPHQVSNLPMSTGLYIYGCSGAIFEKYTSPTGEYLPHLHRLTKVKITSSEEKIFDYERQDPKYIESSTALIPESSDDVAETLTLIEEPIHQNSMFFVRNSLFFIIIFLIGVILLVCLSLLYLY